VPVNEEL